MRESPLSFVVPNREAKTQKLFGIALLTKVFVQQ
jgi:hypothetical protein